MEVKSRYEALAEAAVLIPCWGLFSDRVYGRPSKLRKFASVNRIALKAAHEALKNEFARPTPCELSFLNKRVSNYLSFIHLGRAFSVEFQLALSANDLNGALRTGVETLELGAAVRCGGSILDMFLSGDIVRIAVDDLCSIRSELAETQRITLIDNLKRIEGELEPRAKIFERDRQLEIGVNENDKEFESRAQAFDDLFHGEYRALHTNLDKRELAPMRMLAVDLALRSHHALTTSYPDSIAALASDAADWLPLDPFTDMPFVYRRLSDDTFELFSPGPTRDDHGCAIGPLMESAAGLKELCLIDGQRYPGDYPRQSFASRIPSSLQKVWTRWTSGPFRAN